MKQPRSREKSWAGRFTTTMKTLLILVCSVVLSVSVLADQQVNSYKPSSNGKVNRGCVSVTFILEGVFTGTIGNATHSTAASTQTVFTVSGVGEGKLLGEIPYTLGGAGSLIIMEVR